MEPGALFAGGLFGFIIIVFCIIAAIMAFFVPFFIFRIRNETIAINKKLTQVIELLGGQGTIGEVIHCANCNAKNRAGDPTCINCGQPLVAKQGRR